MFATFPQFTKLQLSDKDEYEAFIRDYPALSEYSFVTLLTWWSFLEPAAVSRLNDNLVISCWIPGDEENSGLSLVGNKKIDETMCTLFDQQKENGDMPRLVHVPEFVIGHMRFPEIFKFTPEREYDECVVSTEAFYPLTSANSQMRAKIKKFLLRVGEDRIAVRSLDLSLKENQDLLLDRAERWLSRGFINNVTKLEQETTPLKVREAEEFGIENVCLFIDGQLEGFFLYHLPSDKRYVIASYARVNPDITGVLNFLLYSCAKRFAERGISYINLDFDLGLPYLRAYKLALGPVNFFRKYTVEPL